MKTNFERIQSRFEIYLRHQQYHCRKKEKMMLGLRTDRGIAADSVLDQKELLSELEKQRLLRREGNRIILTSRGRLIADTITEELI